MSHPLVVNVKFSKCDIYCGRGTKWGNRYIIGKDGDRRTVIYMHKWLQLPELIKDIYELTGKILGCHCSPLSCHCDIYAELANNKESLKQYLRELLKRRNNLNNK